MADSSTPDHTVPVIDVTGTVAGLRRHAHTLSALALGAENAAAYLRDLAELLDRPGGGDVPSSHDDHTAGPTG